MRIEFVYTTDDQRAFLEDYAERSPDIRTAKRQTAFLVSVMIILIALTSAVLVSSFWPLIMGGVAVYVVVFLSLHSRSINKAYVTLF